MKKVLFSVLMLLLIGTTQSLAEYENPSVVGQVPDRVMITLKSDLFPKVTKSAGGFEVDLPNLDALAKRFEITNMSRRFDWAGAPKKAGDLDLRLHWYVDFPTKYDLETVIAAYEALPEVAKVEAVDIVKMYDVPNDITPNQWYLRSLNLGGRDMRAVGGWAESHGDSNIIFAVLDTGVDWMHPDLGGTGPDYVQGAIYTNWTEYYGTPGVDDDTNGKIDDIRGWDFVHGVNGWEGEDDMDPDNDPMDFAGHGTNVSGCASAITNNGIGIAGCTWGTKIMPVRVGWLNWDGEGLARMDFASDGIIYAARNGAHVINFSFGSSSSLALAISIATSEGAIVCTSAGNDGDDIPDYLGTHPDVLAVAATDESDAKATFSDYGDWIELSAPGVDIYTTAYNPSGPDHTYNSVDGTSFSSPLAAAACALVWSAHPSWTRNQVISKVLTTCDNIDDVNPSYAGLLGYGRVNLMRALDADNFHKVPVEFPTLLDAMNESAAGDTVALWGSEILNGSQTMIAKELFIYGGYNSDYSSRDPIGNPTTITALASSPAMRFQGGTTSTTVVDGFACEGGGGSVFSNPIGGRYGGGIVINQASPTLRNIEVYDNSVGTFSEFGGGGGIAIFNSNVVLENITVHGNSGIHGAGIFIHQGAPTLIDCDIYDNTSYTDNLGYSPLGGGIFISEADVTMINCQINGHTDVESGGGIYVTNGAGTANLSMQDTEIYENFVNSNGGGIYMGGTDITMLRDSVHDNGFTASATFANGGGLYISAATVLLDSLTCQNNTAHIGGGAVIDGSTTAQVMRSLFTGNVSNFFGGGIAFQNVTTGELLGNTVAFNSALNSGGGGIYVSNASPTIANNISAFNMGTTSNANGIHVINGTPVLTCNDVYGNDGDQYGGISDPTGTNGNISEDPLFCDIGAGNFNIDSTSPCAPDHSGGCGLIGALAATCISDPVPGENGDVPLAFKVNQNFPNPFNPATKIRFTLPRDGYTTVRIFDLSGRLVKTLIAEDLPAAVHEVTWNGRNSSGHTVAAGVYFYQVQSGTDAYTGRMALVK